MPTPYHHTYVMKLFDRSVDLAKFEEDTPLYPICRAWMQNQPRNPQVVVKYVKFDFQITTSIVGLVNASRQFWSLLNFHRIGNKI